MTTIYQFEHNTHYNTTARLHAPPNGTVPTDTFWPAEGVYWDEKGNSYILVKDPVGDYRTPEGEQVSMVSINGIGEVRWYEYKGRPAQKMIAEWDLRPSDQLY